MRMHSDRGTATGAVRGPFRAHRSGGGMRPYVCSQTAAQQPAPRQETQQKQATRPPLDAEALLEEHSPRDRVTAIVLRKALDVLLRGSEAARKSALETLVGQGEVAGPLLVACLREDSPEVVESAFEGLRQIGWDCPASSLSDVLGSSNAELRIVALRAARRLTDEQQRPLLERGLRDPNARVRRRAISYVAWHDSSWAVAEIMRLCDDPQPEVRWAAVEALVALRPAQAYEHLKLMMPSLTPTYQHRAAALLARRNDSTDKGAAAQAADQPAVGGPSPGNVPEEAKPAARTENSTCACSEFSGKKTEEEEAPQEPGGDVQTTEKEGGERSWVSLGRYLRRSFGSGDPETEKDAGAGPEVPEARSATDDAPDRIATGS